AEHIHQRDRRRGHSPSPVEGRYFFRKLRKKRGHPLNKHKARQSERRGKRLEAVEKRVSYKIEDQSASAKQPDDHCIPDPRAAPENVPRNPVHILGFLLFLRRNLVQEVEVHAVDHAQDRGVEQAQRPLEPDDEEIGYAQQKKDDFDRMLVFEFYLLESSLSPPAVEQRRGRVD